MKNSIAIILVSIFVSLNYSSAWSGESTLKQYGWNKHVEQSKGLPFLDDETIVSLTFDMLVEGIESADIDKILSLYEKESVVYFEPGIAVFGLEDIELGFKGLIALKPDFTFFSEEIVVVGNLALHLSPWIMVATAPDGQPLELNGLSTVVMRKQRPGVWKMVVDNPNGEFLLAE